MTKEQAIYILRNTAWLGSNEDREKTEEAVRMAVDALYEQKTGRWIFQTITQGKRMWCSNCNSAFDLCCNQIKRYDEATKKDCLWAYCPWCGCKMEVEHDSQ